jgi:hypothetical protein
MKAIIFDRWFQSPDEFKEFCESIGYKRFDIISCSRNYDLMFDERVIEFCEERLSKLWSEMVYKGKESIEFKIGFAGAGYIRDIDTDKTWVIEHNKVDAPIIKYVTPRRNEYGHLSVLYIN